MAFRSIIPFRRIVRTVRQAAPPRPAKRTVATAVRKPASRSSRLLSLIDALDLVNDRVCEVLRDNDLNFTEWQHVQLLHRTFPELYSEPPAPAKPTESCVGTEDRLVAYERRVASGRGLRHEADAKADLLGHKNILLGGFLNQSSFKILGFGNGKVIADEPEDGTCEDCGMDLPPRMTPGYCRCGL